MRVKAWLRKSRFGRQVGRASLTLRSQLNVPLRRSSGRIRGEHGFFQNSRQLRAVSMFSTTSLLDLRRKFGHHSGCAFDGAPAAKHPRRLTIILQRCASARLATLSSPAYRTRRNLRLVSDVIAYQPSSLQPIQTLPAELWHHQGHIEGRSLQQRARRE